MPGSKKSLPTFTPPAAVYKGAKKAKKDDSSAETIAKYAQSRIENEQENQKLVKLEKTARINVLLLEASKLKRELRDMNEDIPPLLECDMNI